MVCTYHHEEEEKFTPASAVPAAVQQEERVVTDEWCYSRYGNELLQQRPTLCQIKVIIVSVLTKLC